MKDFKIANIAIRKELLTRIHNGEMTFEEAVVLEKYKREKDC